MDARLASIKRHLRVMQWLLAAQIAMSLGLLWLMSTILGRLTP